jgi:hypothetical protein
MRPRFVRTAVLCFTATLFAGCTCGVQRDGGDSGALVGQPTACAALADEIHNVEWIKSAAAFRDSGRYYK